MLKEAIGNDNYHSDRVRRHNFFSAEHRQVTNVDKNVWGWDKRDCNPDGQR